VNNVGVCIIEDHAIVRAGIRMLIEREPGIDVVGEATTASEALGMADDCLADVILLDISLRTENGLEFLPQLLHEFNPARVLVLTAIEDVETHLKAVEAGASGVVMKEQAPEILAKAIQAVHSGEQWVSSALCTAALTKLWRQQRGGIPMDPEVAKIALLTAREREVIAVVARGFSGARIAKELEISEATVRHHVTSVLRKLEVSNKLELAVYAFHHGLDEG
jgi:two-component system nitrate/nitrite response regulator NarL